MPVNVPYTLRIMSTNLTNITAAMDIVAVPRTGACILPPGLTMVGNGYVSGTPTARGIFDCTVDFTLTLNGASWVQEGLLTLTVQ